MTSRSKSLRLAAIGVGAAVVLAGCGSSDKGNAQPSGGASGSSGSTVGLAADVPAGYDPCNDVPQAVLDSEKLRHKEKEDSNASGGIKWRGCIWAQTDGYGARIQTTNITVDAVREKNLPDAHEFTINSRRAISTRQVDEHPQWACTLDVEMKGGSLEFNLSNPPSRKNTGQLDSCELTRALAEKVVPTMPGNA
ncbi:DUF3558 domain-containing protein [Nocardia sp. NPDC049707]|uniref:DUF3558 domain-containing protein n=1 Tax=Nocardia sp. NPDC049707 TaxID=3154735 RepID=UPI00343BB2C1